MVVNMNKHSSTVSDKTINSHVQQESSVISLDNSKTFNTQEKKIMKKKSEENLYKQRKETLEKSDTVISIDQNDLEELRTVYTKCKEVMLKIENKYGHLLNLNDSGTKCKDNSDEELEQIDKCNCKTNKKIIFDDDGEVISTEPVLDSHICPKKLKRKHSDVEASATNIQVEFEKPESILSDNIVTLSTILRDPHIETTYRNRVIHRIKSIKQEFIDELKFNKKSLIEKVKSKPEEIFEFKGSNLCDLPGYF